MLCQQHNHANWNPSPHVFTPRAFYNLYYRGTALLLENCL